MAQTHYLSQQAFDRLAEEHKHLTTEWRIEIARKIEAAREMGDLKENGDYHAAKEEQGKTEARIRHLEALMEVAQIVDESEVSDAVTGGSIVSIVYEDDEDPERYLIGKEFARGGMGRIMSARDRRLGRNVALKELLRNEADPSARFIREALVTARLQHPAIVSVYEAGRWPTGEPFYAMKLVSGRPLVYVIADMTTM